MKGLAAVVGLTYALILGAACGLGLTWWTTGNDFRIGSLRIGPWTAWPLAAPLDADRYSRARIARSGDLPLGPGEGLAFTAREDSAGVPLDGACQYSVGPLLPPARWWSIALYDKSGKSVDNPSNRYGFASSAVLRNAGGAVTIAVAPSVQPGNWLPSRPGPVTLVLRLYDSPISTGLAAELGARSASVMPDIQRIACLTSSPS